MTKNFKKVISTVAALAMAASSFVAMAATYPDVQADNKYYSAIEQVSALGIIEGFEDGTFKPDEKVTRAQMAKLVVGAKNLLAEAEGNTRQVFDDVAPGKSEWAMGYVATANDYKIVNGTSATTFDPEATVTYMQAMKMLVVAAGYEDWAQDQGGWPEGYRYYGNQLKIGAGVSGVSDDTELTRGQVAQMLVNALKAPILDITGYERDNGEKYPIYAQLDGKNDREYQTLLTDAWDVYEVYGRVLATSRSGATEVGEVNYQVEKSDNYDDEEYKMGYDTNGDPIGYTTIMGAAAGESGAEDLLLEYSYALVSLNDDDEAEIVYIESAGKNKTVEFDGELIADATTSQIDVYKNENTNSTTKYKLSANAMMLVNGVVLDIADTDDITDAIAAYATAGNVTLVDSPQEGVASIDGEYDYIVVEYYATGIVSEVVADEDEIEIVIDYSNDTDVDELVVDLTDDEVSYAFADKAGAEVDPATIAKDTIISVAYNVNEGWDTSSFYNAIISTDKVEGRISSTYTDTQGTQWYVVNGTDYEWAETTPDVIEAGNSYTMYLDKDGKIAKREILASSVNYAIVDRYFSSAGDSKVRLILKDGTKADYVIDTDNSDASDVLAENVAETLNETLANDGEAGLAKRFVTYTVNKNNEVKLEAVETAEYKYDGDAKYTEKSSRIGSYGVADTSVILDASAYASNATKSVAVSAIANLVDEMDYGVVVLGQRDQSSATYPMAVIIRGANAFTVNTRMAVVASAVSTVEVDNMLKDQVEVVVGGETVALVADQGGVLSTLNEGDAVIYYNDAEGEVADLRIIYSAANIATLKNTANSALAASMFGALTPSGSAITFNGEDGDTVEFAVYPVIKKYASSVAVADDADLTAVADTGTDLDYDADAVAYEYDGSLKKNWVSAISLGAIKTSSIRTANIDQENHTINLKGAENKVAYAVVRMVDDQVQEVYSIYFD